MSIRMEVNAAQFYKGCASKYCAAEGRNRRQHGEAARMAGFPLPLDNFFRQLERNCENSLSHQFPQNRNKPEGDGV